LSFTPAQIKAYRAKKAALGFCTRCCQRPAREGKRQCVECAAELLRNNKRNKKKWQKMADRCSDCGARISGEFAHCLNCRVRSRAVTKRLEARYRREGRCHSCASLLPEKGWHYCSPCQERRNFYYLVGRGARV